MNTIIEEEKKDKNVELLKRYIREAYPQGDALIGLVDDVLTTAMQRAYEAGVQNTLTKVISTTNGQPGEIEYSQNPRDAFTTGWQQATAQYRTQVQSLLKEISH